MEELYSIILNLENWDLRARKLYLELSLLHDDAELT